MKRNPSPGLGLILAPGLTRVSPSSRSPTELPGCGDRVRETSSGEGVEEGGAGGGRARAEARPPPGSDSFHSSVLDCIVLRGFDTAGRTVSRGERSARQCVCFSSSSRPAKVSQRAAKKKKKEKRKSPQLLRRSCFGAGGD